MSLTLNEIQYSVLEAIRNNISDDDSVDLREVAYEIHNQRALWLRNELNKNRTIDDNITQDLECVDMELVDKTDCAEFSDGCKVLRTVSEIPTAIELHNSTAITRVASIDKTIPPFSFVSYTQALWSGNGRFNKNNIFAFLLNKHIYLVGHKDNITINMITKINIRLVAENPVEVANFITCSGDCCYSDDGPYPLNRWMVNYIKAEVIKQFIPQSQLPEDASNDADGKLSGGK